MNEEMFTVVVNHEEQYSIWPGDRAIPAGWVSKAVCGSKEECLEYIRAHWVDMTPASLRK